MGSDWSFQNIYFLSLITTGYIIGEIAHFLLSTTSREVATDVHYGEQVCEAINDTYSDVGCDDYKDESSCLGLGHNTTCDWVYNGQGTDFQILVGPAFIYTFSAAALIFGIALDRFNRLSLF